MPVVVTAAAVTAAGAVTRATVNCARAPTTGRARVAARPCVVTAAPPAGACAAGAAAGAGGSWAGCVRRPSRSTTTSSSEPPREDSRLTQYALPTRLHSASRSVTSEPGTSTVKAPRPAAGPTLTTVAVPITLPPRVGPAWTVTS